MVGTALGGMIVEHDLQGEIVLIERSPRFWPVDHPIGSLAGDRPKARFLIVPGGMVL